jgi:hypothetical protein
MSTRAVLLAALLALAADAQISNPQDPQVIIPATTSRVLTRATDTTVGPVLALLFVWARARMKYAKLYMFPSSLSIVVSADGGGRGAAGARGASGAPADHA